MKLTDMGTRAYYGKMNRIFESRFGFTVDFNNMSMTKAQKLTRSLTEAIAKIRLSSDIHSSEKSPKYTELILVRESLVNWMQEKKQLTEGEVGQAEALLAARDIVDSIQNMIEKAGKIQNEQLPALADTIRDQIGSAEADAFKASIGQMLATLAGQLTLSRDQADSSVRALTGDVDSSAMQVGGVPQEGPEINGQEDLDNSSDGFDAADAAVGGNDAAGRELR